MKLGGKVCGLSHLISFLCKVERNDKYMSLIAFLGKDSGFGDNNNSAYIEYNGNFVLIDCRFCNISKIKK